MAEALTNITKFDSLITHSLILQLRTPQRTSGKPTVSSLPPCEACEPRPVTTSYSALPDHPANAQPEHSIRQHGEIVRLSLVVAIVVEVAVETQSAAA